jgi:hypothetical protein
MFISLSSNNPSRFLKNSDCGCSTGPNPGVCFPRLERLERFERLEQIHLKESESIERNEAYESFSAVC